MEINIEIRGTYSDDSSFYYFGSDIDDAIAELTYIESQKETIKNDITKKR